ncbi:MAG: ABC transporter ATP-binding protein [Solobacterium sp.]|nr:ABC transporter ATP-binding protein [Solobacterium sp.]
MSMRGGPGGRGAYMTEEEKAAAPKVTKELLARVGSYLLPYWKQMLIVLIAIAVASVLGMMPAVLTGKIIDDGLIGRNLDLLVKLILASLAVSFGSNLIGVLQSWMNTWIAEHITYDMRSQMFRHLQKMPQSFFTSNNQGDIITRMTSDISGVQRIITDTLTSILSNVITLIVALVAMYQRNWILATLGVMIVPLFTIPTRSAGKKRWSLTRESQAVSDEINGILNETLSVSGQTLVKLFNREEREAEKYEAAAKKQITLNIKENMAGRWFRVIISTFTTIGPMLIYLVGGILMMKYNSDITVGDITVMVSLLSRMYGPVNSLLNIQVDWIRSMAMFTRIFEYLDMPVSIESAPDAVTPDHVEGNIVFDDVHFSYEPSREILKGIDFELKAGSSIALVGPSGSGKSTIINLIPRLYDVDSGSVSFDGIDVRKLDLTFLREQVGIVSQETYLFNGTIMDNLKYANPKATGQMIMEACKKANIYDFIVNQEKGFNTMVGNRGLKLSGGEKQRLSIARVLLKDPTILIFDEATSALDSISENLIQEAIDPLIKEKTSILIAHRLSTILAADEILVIKDGRIVERGKHSELVKAGGVYTELYETQFKKALES